MRRLVLAAVIGLVLVQPALADQPPVLGRGETVANRDLAQWAVSLDRWIFGVRAKAVKTPGACLSHDTGTVMFVGASGEDEHVYDATCTIPAGRYLMLGGPQMNCTDIFPMEGFSTTARGLESCARHYWPAIADPHPRLVLDGVAIAHGPVVHPPAFRFALPRDNLFGRPRVRHGRAAMVGRATILRPLAPGVHTLIQGIHYRVTHNMVSVLHLNVV